MDIKAIKEHLISAPIIMNVDINAGFIDKNHWVHDKEIGGGRIVGEACHQIDLFQYLSGSRLKEVCALNIGKVRDTMSDTATIIVKTENGSCCSINYYSTGSTKYYKEKFVVSQSGHTYVNYNYKKLEFYGKKTRKTINYKRIEKGHKEQFEELFKKKNMNEICATHDYLKNSTKAMFSIAKSITERRLVEING